MQTLSRTSYAAYTVLFVAAILFSIGWVPSANLGLLLLFSLGLYGLRKQTKTSSSFCTFSPKVLTHPLWCITLMLGLAAAIYRPQDFNYPLLWSTESLYENGSSFQLYINLSKAIGGYLIVVYFARWLAPPSTAMNLRASVILASCGTIALLLICWAGFGIAWQPKLSSGLAFFILVNLLVTVISEEAFFRLLIQKYLTESINNKYLGFGVPVFVATIIFTLAHSTTIGPAFGLYLIAGLIYSLVYAITQRFYIAVAVHFSTNLLHFIFLEYPLQF